MKDAVISACDKMRGQGRLARVGDWYTRLLGPTHTPVAGA